MENNFKLYFYEWRFNQKDNFKFYITTFLLAFEKSVKNIDFSYVYRFKN
jgi:hypothetical protein